MQIALTKSAMSEAIELPTSLINAIAKYVLK